MDTRNSSSTNTGPSRSGIPRPASKLPRAAPTLRPVPSADTLYGNTVSELRVPRLRNSTSKDTVRPAKKRESSIPPPRTHTGREPLRDVSTSTILHQSPNKTVVIKKSNPLLRSKISHDTFRPPLPQTTPFDTSDLESTGYNAEGNTTDDRITHLRRVRPSLSERTMETLSQLPSSPAVKPRGTSGESRPGSSSSRDSILPPSRSVSSRRSSSGSHKADIDYRMSMNTFKSTPQRPNNGSPSGTPSTAGSTTSNFGSIKRSGQSRLVTPGFRSTRQGALSPEKFPPLPTINSGSKTVSSRMIRPRATVQGLFQQSGRQTPDRQAAFGDIDHTVKLASPTFPKMLSAKSRAPRAASASSMYPKQEDLDTTKVPKGSQTLRDQIAKAKAAAKKAQAQKASAGDMAQDQAEASVIPTGSFEFGLADDHFNQALDQGGNKGLLRKRVDSARRDGRLNIAAMGLTEIPQEVMKMYDLDSLRGGSWAETVDLTRFVAADNKFETLSDEVFPDTDPREIMDDEDSTGNQFAGLEMLDLHGNILTILPMGLRRLEFLTVLNLSSNKLPMDCFEILSQIPNLKDLRLSNNMLSGPLSDRISRLRNLEVLHIQKNSVTSLPDALADLGRLRVLNVSENLLESIPFGILQNIPLAELHASKNKLGGALINEDVRELPHLHVLDVTNNSLTSLCAATDISLPAMHQLNCGANRLSWLPDMTSWTSLLTLVADGNSISELPEGFVGLNKLKSVDFSCNNLKSLDERIGAMANLEVLRISGNPLREKKVSGMSTEDLKHALKIRMAPPEIEEEEYDDEDTLMPQDDTGLLRTPTSPNRPSSPWTVKSGGILDRSNTQSYSLNPVVAAQVAQNNSIRALELHHNIFREIPSSVAFFSNTLTSLNLSHNELTSDSFLPEGLDLIFLKELNLSSNTFNSLAPLTMRLFAPNLEKLDISFNRLTSLPVLRTHFPKLRVLNASNNTIRDLHPESVKGLRMLDCSSNELNSLNARIGLLGGPGGLEVLDVRGNRFRVPRWEILEKGTEVTLAWLRDRIPRGSMIASESGRTSASGSASEAGASACSSEVGDTF